MKTRVFPAHAGLILTGFISGPLTNAVFPAHAGLIPSLSP